MLRFQFLLLIFFSFQVNADVTNLQLTSACDIYSWDGKLLLNLPGKMCLYLDDGRFLRVDRDGLAMVNSDKSISWKISGHFHHQLNFSEDKEFFLAISSQFVKINDRSFRFDVFSKIDKNGKVIAETTTQTLLEYFNQLKLSNPFDWDADFKDKADLEGSHFNSFYEIPKQKKQSQNKEIQAGNFVVNSIKLGAFILDKNLKPLSQYKFANSEHHSVHDVQVTPDGKMLYFNNERIRDKSKMGPRSAIEVIDPSNFKSKIIFAAEPAELFYAFASGSVQMLDSNYLLVSHFMNGYYLYDTKKRKIVKANKLEKPLFRTQQQIKAFDLRNFLKKWSVTF